MPNGDRYMKMHEEIMRSIRHLENAMWAVGSLLITLSVGGIYMITKLLLQGDGKKNFLVTLTISLSLVVAWITFLGFLKFAGARLQSMENFARGLTNITYNFWDRLSITLCDDKIRCNGMNLPNWFRRIYCKIPVVHGLHGFFMVAAIVIFIILLIVIGIHFLNTSYWDWICEKLVG